MNEKQVEKASTTTTPVLDILFDGLFFLCFNTNGKPAQTDPAAECRIGFVTTAPPHQVFIDIERKIVDLEGVPRVIKLQTTLKHAQARRMEIDLIVPGVVTPSVTRKGHDQPIDRSKPLEANKDYFKWIIDLENEEMHNTALQLKAGVLKPVMHIPTGEFYTKDLSTVRYFRTRVDSKETPFGAVATKSGVRVAQLPQNKAQLKIGNETHNLIAHVGESCVVRIANRCPKCDDKQLGSLHLSDFPQHYNAFEVGILDQYDFDYSDEEPPAIPPAICYAASGSRTTNI